MRRTITLTPAYGRDYKSKDEVIRALLDGKDFILNSFSDPYDGKPCNLEDLQADGVLSVNVRYSGLKKIVCISFDKLKREA